MDTLWKTEWGYDIHKKIFNIKERERL